MAALKKVLSWIWPLQVKRVEGKLTAVLEVTYEQGKKVLNAGEVNYSFGALHNVFRIALQKAKIIESPPADVLILGFGAGSIASILVEEFGQHPRITGIEADPVVLHLAREEFNISRFPELEIENTTAEKFIATCNSRFNLIAVDVFVEAHVPESCKTHGFLENIYRCLAKNGRVVFNEMPKENLSGENEFLARFRNNFDETEVHELHIGGSPNRILIGYRRK
ncbi:MAG: methyltransferase domain-containing protein [Bacteroidota bacterium]|nr:methyltransferase domain-containing protein [Bacteroidota bacterium]